MKCVHSEKKFNFAAGFPRLYCKEQQRFVLKAECCKDCPLFKKEDN